MSALGHKRTFAVQKAHVRFTPKSGHVRCTRHVRFVPIADISAAKKIAIRSPRQRVATPIREAEAEGLADLEIDHKFDFVDARWKGGRLLAFKDPVDVGGRATENIGSIRPIGDQTALGDELPIWGNERHPVMICRLQDRFTHSEDEYVRCGDQTAARLANWSLATRQFDSATLRHMHCLNSD